MNISPINFKNTAVANNSNVQKLTYQSTPKMYQTLHQDTVSFSGGKIELAKSAAETVEQIAGKVMPGRTKDISYKMGMEIHEESRPAMAEFLGVLRRGLKNLTETSTHSENPIAIGNIGIKGRVKSANSIIEKALSNKLVTKNEIANMGDVVAARIVLRDSSQESFDLVFKALEKMIKEGNLNVKELENYRFEPKDSYLSNKTLTRFEATCVKCGLRPAIINKTRDNAYTAVHLTVLLPNKQLAEIQIMGRDIEQVKELEDFYYKLKCKKSFPPKYKAIQQMMKEKLAKLSPFQKTTLDEYIKDSYINAKKMPPLARTPHEYSVDNFIDIPYSLPQELGYKYLYRMKEAADLVANLM